MKSPIQWKRFLGLIRQSITNTFSQQRCFSMLTVLTLLTKTKKALGCINTTQKFWNFDGISFVSTKGATHFFAVRVFISTDGIFKVNGIFYFSEWFFYFASFLKVFFQSNFGRDGFSKTQNCLNACLNENWLSKNRSVNLLLLHIRLFFDNICWLFFVNPFKVQFPNSRWQHLSGKWTNKKEIVRKEIVW